MNTLKNKTILITGASKGLGQKVAITLASPQNTIIINYLKNKTGAQKAVSDIKALGSNALAIQADVREPEQVSQMFQTIEKEFGGVDILVNNVGEFLYQSFDDISAQDWQNMINSNLNSTFYCCKAALPFMRLQQWGRIINIGLANAGIKAYQNVLPYAIAKSGVHILSKSLAKQEAVNGITVNVIALGLMDNGSITEAQKKIQADSIPMGRSGSADDILGVIQYLISDKAEYVTGTEIIVSGGWGL